MAAFPFDIIGFDLDGTLLDTSGDLLAATNHALALADRPPLTAKAIRPMIGGGARLMLQKGLDASGGGDVEAFKPTYRALLEHYEANIAVHTRPFPGAVEAIVELAALGVEAAVVTNKFERFAIKLLAELGLAARFGCVIGGDTLGKGLSKPHRAPIDEMLRRCGCARAAFVGDSAFDMMAARNAGIPAIAVSFGFLSGPVAELEADAVIDSFDELIPTLRRLG
ncbi:MAG: HAD-IA family hydrolase [Sphingomonadaceae bacterium]|nr:HAD-IA family hydrolase [Sphingomonadaceae bacterium]